MLNDENEIILLMERTSSHRMILIKNKTGFEEFIELYPKLLFNEGKFVRRSII